MNKKHKKINNRKRRKMKEAKKEDVLVSELKK